MGNFYSNIVVTGVLGDRMIEWMRGRGSAAFVEVSDLGSVIFDEAAESDYSHEGLAREISNALGGLALVVTNHDDDILSLEVYQNGEVVDSYNSAPNYFDEDADETAPPSGGDQLVDLFAVDAGELHPILTSDEYLFAVERHQAVFEVLSLPMSSCGSSFADLSRGTTPRPSHPSAVLISINGAK